MVQDIQEDFFFFLFNIPLVFLVCLAKCGLPAARPYSRLWNEIKYLAFKEVTKNCILYFYFHYSSKSLIMATRSLLVIRPTKMWRWVMRDILLLEEWGLDTGGFSCFFVFFHKIFSQIWYVEPSEFHGLFVKLYVPEHHCVILYQSL